MRKQKKLLTGLLIVLFGVMYGQQQQKTYTNQFINNAITEVFQNYADDLVFNSSSKRLQVIERFFKDQLSIQYLPKLKGKEFDSTNDLPLNNKYNLNLQRDLSYNSNTFNPLKYGIQISPLKRVHYRIADTDYIIIVTPFKN